MLFGEKIKALRKAKKLSQDALAEAVDVSPRTVRGWETEGRYPQNRALYERLASTLGCETDYLLSEKDYEEGVLPAGGTDIEKVVSDLTGLFAGGQMSEEDMDALMFAVQQAYVDAKRRKEGNRRLGGE